MTRFLIALTASLALAAGLARACDYGCPTVGQALVVRQSPSVTYTTPAPQQTVSVERTTTVTVERSTAPAPAADPCPPVQLNLAPAYAPRVLLNLAPSYSYGHSARASFAFGVHGHHAAADVRADLALHNARLQADLAAARLHAPKALPSVVETRTVQKRGVLGRRTVEKTQTIFR